MTPLVVTETVALGSSIEDVWPLIADTGRVNRALGLPPMKLRPVAPGSRSSARFLGETTVLGLRVEFEELPFEWAMHKRIRVVRRVRNGPMSAVTTSFELEPGVGPDNDNSPRGTRLTIGIEIVPRRAAYRPLAWLFARGVMTKMRHLVQELDAHAAGQKANPLAVAESTANPRVLEAAVREMKKNGADGNVAEKIGAFVKAAPDYELVRMRPFELAREWSMDRHTVLSAMLHGVPAGLVDLRWGIICPSCLTASSEVSTLAEIPTHGRCELCDVSFDLDLDRAVEATFIVHSSVRSVSTQTFCSGGPGRLPHVLAQTVVESGESGEVNVPVAPGRYRVFARGGASMSLVVEPGGESRVQIVLEDSALRPADARVAPGGAAVVTNRTNEGRHVKLEHLGYASEAATAHIVSTMPQFRPLFSSDLLKPSTPLRIGRAAILFSDLTGSTALYTKVGDAAAFRLVDDHFDMIRGIVAERGGSFVKTMGDAVMAAFSDVDTCARAAMDALERFDSFCEGRLHAEHVGLKLGMNAGPCYIVTANGALDYFGQTVNVASRVQHLAGMGELVVAREHYDALPEADRARVVVGETFEATVKGLDSPMSLVRLKARRRIKPSTSSPSDVEALPPRA